MADKKYLIDLIKNSQESKDLLKLVNKEDFREALHSFYINNDFGAMRELLNNMTSLYSKNKNYQDYMGIFDRMFNSLDCLSSEADKSFNLKKPNKQIGPIQEFYRDSINELFYN